MIIDDAVPERRQLCSFSVGELLFGVDVTRVQEVLRHQELTVVPLAPGAVGGLINLRGQIVTAIELRRLLDLPPRQDGEGTLTVVLRTPDGPVSLLVDSIGDVVQAEGRQYEGAPDTLSERYRRLIDGVYKVDHQLVLALNLESALMTGIAVP
ncbi:MAG: chemotaxis protein CheW [Acidobacteriota bacterium]